jgi:RES domain-containing protein
MIAWRIGTDTGTYTALDPSGAGAQNTGGRWNRKGTAVVYSSTTIALACMETLVHLNVPLPLNRYLVQLDIPDGLIHKAHRFDQAKNVGWDAIPAGLVSLEFGERWLAGRTSAILFVPSSIIPEEDNILINPTHPDAKQVLWKKIRRFQYDPRIKKV